MADDKDEPPPENPDPHFEPLVSLPQVEVSTMEEDEDVMVKLRSKLFRYDSESEPPEWKERGTGDVKILQHKESHLCRVLMRRDKTHKLCANHYVLPYMELKPNCGSDRAWVWSTPADCADEDANQELLAIRFANAENAQKFKEKFYEAKVIMAEHLPKLLEKGKKNDKTSEKTEDNKPEENGEEAEKVVDKLEGLSVKDDKKEDESESPTEKGDSTSGAAES